MQNPKQNTSIIKEEAAKLGFDACGITNAELLKDDSIALRNWLSKGYHADMDWMENHFEKRIEPSKLIPGTQSIIVLLQRYFPEKTQLDKNAPVLSKYAYGEDYHFVLKRKLKILLLAIQEKIAGLEGRAFVDSAPVLERALARKSGLGWIGKNANLISPKHGSFVFISSLFVNIPLKYDKPILDYCGGCTKCITACPTKAIIKPGLIDSNKCISYLTIENKKEIPTEFKETISNRVFGCDICQDVCPWNRKSEAHQIPEFKPKEALLDLTKDDWHQMNEVTFQQLFRKSAVKRAKYAGLQRNINFLNEENK